VITAAPLPVMVSAIDTRLLENPMTIRHTIVSGAVVQWLLLTALPAANSAFANADETHIQFCWVLGKYDNTAYFAEVEDREDRQASFTMLIEIIGIDHHSVECRISSPTSHRLLRADLMKQWSDSELQIVNTTFLSDLDY
jgi:hypothetical protein